MNSILPLAPVALNLVCLARPHPSRIQYWTLHRRGESGRATVKWLGSHLQGRDQLYRLGDRSPQSWDARMVVGRHALVTGGGTGVDAPPWPSMQAGATGHDLRPARRSPSMHRAAGVHAIVADVTQEAEVAALHAEAGSLLRPTDIVVANAGMSGTTMHQPGRLAAHAGRQPDRLVPDVRLRWPAYERRPGGSCLSPRRQV